MSIPSPPRLLLVEGDLALRNVLQDALAEMGYSCTVASSPEQALRMLHRQPVDLIVTETFSRTRQDVLAPSCSLLNLSHPTPVIVCTAWPVTETEVREHGFAALVPKPFLLDQLVTTVAECLNQPFSEEQRRQAEVVQRFLVAASRWDIDAVVALVTADMVYYPWLVSPYPAARPVIGRTAASAYLQEMARYFGPVRLDAVRISPCPHGLAARFLLHWGVPEGAARQQMVCLCFQITDEGQVGQVGMPLQDHYLRRLLDAPPEGQPGRVWE
jgi:CheY-like chemotaxis protein